jgi:outer membrane lipoprotein-sorting protein
MKIVKLSGLLLAAGLLAAAAPAFAQSPPSAADAQSIMQRMEQRNASLQSFQARVHVNTRMLNFPWLSPKLDGTSYFKRPDNYMVVFDRVPSYAHGITKLFGDTGDAIQWQKEWNVAFSGEQNVGGKRLLALTMTKKIYSDQINDRVAFVDPATFQVVRMDTHYRNGGTISMTQTFKTEGGYTVIATQHADINIPHVHAVADATYGTYQMNVAVADSVFRKK